MVLPEPVLPRPSTSRPASVAGRVAAWIGNGVARAERGQHRAAAASVRRVRRSSPMTVRAVRAGCGVRERRRDDGRGGRAARDGSTGGAARRGAPGSCGVPGRRQGRSPTRAGRGSRRVAGQRRCSAAIAAALTVGPSATTRTGRRCDAALRMPGRGAGWSRAVGGRAPRLPARRTLGTTGGAAGPRLNADCGRAEEEVVMRMRGSHRIGERVAAMLADSRCP